MVYLLYIVTYITITNQSWEYLHSTLHRAAFCQFPFLWIYYCHSSKSNGKENAPLNMHYSLLKNHLLIKAEDSNLNRNSFSKL